MNMTANECLEALTNVHSALWKAHSLRMQDNGDDTVTQGLARCATMVGDAASTLSNMQASMKGHYALEDMLTK
jgi:hypothetical protein